MPVDALFDWCSQNTPGFKLVCEPNNIRFEFKTPDHTKLFETVSTAFKNGWVYE